MKYRSLLLALSLVFAFGLFVSLSGIATAQEVNIIEACEDPCVTDTEEAGVFLCHVPPGNPNAARTVCILAEDAEAHKLHHIDDTCGECDLPLIVDCEDHHPVRCGDDCCDPPEAKKCDRGHKNCCEIDCGGES